MSTSGLFCPQCGQLNDAAAAVCAHCGVAQPNTTPMPTSVQAPVAPASSPVAAPQMTAYAPAQTAYAPAQTVYAGQTAYSGQTGYAPVPVYAVTRYGGFWIRVLAHFIDGVILQAIMMPVSFILFGSLTLVPGGGHAVEAAVITGFLGFMLIVFAVQWLYFAVMESSTKQATLGKMICGLKVTDANGNRMSFGRATGRYFAKIISSITLCIGYIMVGLTERKQGLHDMIAGTFVIKP